jgi:hypothetical protein
MGNSTKIPLSKCLRSIANEFCVLRATERLEEQPIVPLASPRGCLVLDGVYEDTSGNRQGVSFHLLITQGFENSEGIELRVATVSSRQREILSQGSFTGLEQWRIWTGM